MTNYTYLTLTLTQVIDIINVLGKFYETEMNFPFAYKIARNISKLRGDLEYYDKQKSKLIATMGTPVDGQPGQFTITEEKRASLQIKLASLGAQQTTKRKYITFTIDELSHYKVSPSEINNLLVLIDDPEFTGNEDNENVVEDNVVVENVAEDNIADDTNVITAAPVLGAASENSE